jgi:hypothetical protein
LPRNFHPIVACFLGFPPMLVASRSDEYKWVKIAFCQAYPKRKTHFSADSRTPTFHAYEVQRDISRESVATKLSPNCSLFSWLSSHVGCIQIGRVQEGEKCICAGLPPCENEHFKPCQTRVPILKADFELPKTDINVFPLAIARQR